MTSREKQASTDENEDLFILAEELEPAEVFGFSHGLRARVRGTTTATGGRSRDGGAAVEEDVG